MSGCSSGCWRRCSASSGIAPIYGSAKTSAHNFVFLEGVKAALTADSVWQDGWFATPPTRVFQAMGRVYAGWGLSQAFYREEIWRKIGFSSLEDFLIGSCEANFRRPDANDLLAMRADRADLRFGQDLGPQFRFSRGRQAALTGDPVWQDAWFATRRRAASK